MSDRILQRGEYEFHDVLSHLREPPLTLDKSIGHYERFPGFERVKPFLSSNVFDLGRVNKPEQWAVQGSDWTPSSFYLLADNQLVILTRKDEFQLGKRKPNTEYWPTEQQAEKDVVSWVVKFRKALHEAMSDCAAYTHDPAVHWMYAKRRYGIKNNPYTRLVYLTEIDPEGRFRWQFEKMPEYLYRLLDKADRLVGLEAGISDAMTQENHHILG